MQKIGYVGLGLMGANMCRRLSTAPDFDLLVYDVDPAKAAALEGSQCKAATSLHALATECHLIACSLPSPQAVRQVMAELGRHATPGTVIVDFSTVDPGTSREVAAALEMHGIRYLDAPVSGGVNESLNGKLMILLGASEDEAAPVRDLLARLASRIHYVGRRGAGSLVKLLNNLMAMGNQLIAAEAFALGVKGGVEADALYEILKECGGTSERLVKHFPSILKGDFAPRFTVDLAEKDLSLVLKTARELKTPMMASSIVHALYLMTSQSGRGDRNSTAVIELLETMSGVLVRSTHDFELPI